MLCYGRKNEIPSAVIPCYQKFFILRLISNHPRVWGPFTLRALKVNFLKFKRNIRLESSISGNIKSYVTRNLRKFFKVSFFGKNFEGWRRKVLQVAIFCKTFHRRCLTLIWYASGSEYTRVLNMPLFLNMLGFWIYVSWNLRKTFFKKI